MPEVENAIRRICQLQPLYTADNSEAMQERGRLVRTTLAKAVKARVSLLSEALDGFGDDFHVDASDGVGRKTECPWVRFCSKSMSPSPRQGFYCVIHFSTDGSAVHFTVGCGSSRYSNGSFSALPDEELLKRTSWARRVIAEDHGTLEPFVDAPNFGAKRPLTRSFEQATAVSKRVGVEELDSTDIDSLLAGSARLLASLYRAERDGRDLSPADQDELVVMKIVSPLRKKEGQGIGGLSAPDRKRVELRAMELTAMWLKSSGYITLDTSATKPYDYLANKGEKSVKIEVKGTTSDQCDAVLMTRNEVELHRAEKGNTALCIVYGIRLTGSGEFRAATGGMLRMLWEWEIDSCDLEPVAYRVLLK
jgi:hypothetical protein